MGEGTVKKLPALRGKVFTVRERKYPVTTTKSRAERKKKQIGHEKGKPESGRKQEITRAREREQEKPRERVTRGWTETAGRGSFWGQRTCFTSSRGMLTFI